MVRMDTEDKITEFNYEQFIHPELLKGLDNSSADFKYAVRVRNFMSATENEHLQNCKADF